MLFEKLFVYLRAMNKFGKNREVDNRYLNVPVKYITSKYNGSNEGEKDKSLCIIDFYGNDKALVGWRNNETCKMGMTRVCKIVHKDGKHYLKYKDKLILISDPYGWVF